jgi:hypothetical protein
MAGPARGRQIRAARYHLVFFAPRHRTLRIQRGRYSSLARPLDVSDGETVSFRCHGAMLWPRFVASVVKPDLAISLHRE